MLDESAKKKLVDQRLLADSIRRATTLCYAFSIMFTLFSVSIVPVLKTFDENVQYFESFCLRLLFTTIPWVALGQFLSRSKKSDIVKLCIFAVAQGLIFHASGVIDIWRVAIQISPSMMLGVHGINTQYIIVILSFVAVPIRLLATYFVLFSFSTMPGLFYVLLTTRDGFVQTTVLNDTGLAMLAGSLGSYLLSKIYFKLRKLDLERETEASKFLGKDLHSAIFEDRKDLLDEKLAKGFVLFLDIRDSSKLTREFGDKWTAFLKEWMSTAPEVIQQFHGKLLKTGGDSLLVTFGVFEEDVDLSDIPGLEREVASAEERRWKQLTQNAVNCSDRLAVKFQRLAAKHFPDQVLRIGIGIDRGKVWKGVRGNDFKKELDIWGDSVNCASRLESYTKALVPQFSDGASILVMSPYAVDYLESFSGYVKVETHSEIKDFNGIRWVLAKEFKASSANENRPGGLAA